VGSGSGAAAHPEIRLVSSVTAPFIASARPSIVTPVVAVMEATARMLPLKSEFVPSVAELPISQKTLQGSAALMNAMVLDDAVVSVEPTWKIQIASASPRASSVNVPVIPTELGAV
jgi:hypothetical protein